MESMLVEDRILIENEAVQLLCVAHEVQLVHYLTATGTEIGLLFNFGAQSLQFKRKSRTYRPGTMSRGFVGGDRALGGSTHPVKKSASQARPRPKDKTDGTEMRQDRASCDAKACRRKGWSLFAFLPNASCPNLIPSLAAIP